jgi:hypothetical protein
MPLWVGYRAQLGRTYAQGVSKSAELVHLSHLRNCCGFGPGKSIGETGQQCVPRTDPQQERHY